jgi:hypothetical protein
MPIALTTLSALRLETTPLWLLNFTSSPLTTFAPNSA